MGWVTVSDSLALMDFINSRVDFGCDVGVELGSILNRAWVEFEVDVGVYSGSKCVDFGKQLGSFCLNVGSVLGPIWGLPGVDLGTEQAQLQLPCLKRQTD